MSSRFEAAALRLAQREALRKVRKGADLNSRDIRAIHVALDDNRAGAQPPPQQGTPTSGGDTSPVGSNGSDQADTDVGLGDSG